MTRLAIPPTRFAPSVDLHRIVQNKSSRHGVKPQLIVLHSTESINQPGLTDLASIGEWFDNPAANCSAHVCTDGSGNSARYVVDEDKAWSCVYYNSASLNIEQIGRAAQQDWPEAQLQETARWIAKWNDDHGIPIRKGLVTGDGRILKSGVVRHSELGRLGGDHHDPDLDVGDYPLHDVLDLARYYRKLR